MYSGKIQWVLYQQNQQLVADSVISAIVVISLSFSLSLSLSIYMYPEAAVGQFSYICFSVVHSHDAINHWFFTKVIQFAVSLWSMMNEPIFFY